MTSARPPWSEFRAALDARGFRPSRRLGQNFLLDDNVARAIVRDARVEAGDFVLEVGPGCGFLSVHLAAAGARLFAVEIDPRLAEIARGFLAPFEGAQVLVTDVLAGKHEWAPSVLSEIPAEGPWSVVSNLPYSISGPFLAILARLGHPPTRVTVLVQKEVAERLAASPGDSAWGALSARIQWTFDAELGRNVPPQLFWPRPRVESAVVHLSLRAAAGRSAMDTAAFDRAVSALFQTRRKSLRRVLANTLGETAAADRVLAETGLAGERRAETLTLEELARVGGCLG